MMSIREKYGLTDEGVRNVKLGAAWTAVSNIAVFGGVGIIFMAMGAFADHLVGGAPLPDVIPYLAGLTAFIAALFVTEYFAYYYQYGVIYKESGRQRIGLAERLLKLPQSFFGRRDLADLTETIMGDVKTIEHAYSHVLPELYGAYIVLGVAAVCLLAMDWRLAVAALWSAPVALALLFASRRFLAPLMKATRMKALAVSEDIQEALECVREVRATNQEERYLDGIRADIDAAEAQAVKSELATGVCVNGAQVVLRLGIATTILAGAALILDGSCSFMTLFCFLLVVSRIYAPFDQCLMLIAELFAAKTASARMRSFYEEPLAQGSQEYTPAGHDVVFEGVSFSYGGGEKVLDGVSFTAKEGEVTALVGPSGSGKSTCARLAARLWDAEDGHVRVGGVDVSSVDPEVLLRDFSVVFQDVVLFDDTVAGNIRLGRRGASDEEVLAAARAGCPLAPSGGQDRRRDRAPHAHGGGGRQGGGARRRTRGRAGCAFGPHGARRALRAHGGPSAPERRMGALGRRGALSPTRSAPSAPMAHGRTVDHIDLIAARMEQARFERGIPVAELARRVGVDRKRLGRILNGERAMRADEFVRLCEELKLGLERFDPIRNAASRVIG